MKRSTRTPSLSVFLLGFTATALFAGDGVKTKVLEKCDQIDPKALRITDAKAKVVTTSDPEHRKVIELFLNYAHAGGGSGMGKDFPEGIHLAKYSAIRFWVRSDCGTSFSFGISGHYTRKDGKFSSFHGGGYKATDKWTQVTFPFDKFRRGGATIWKNNAQVVIPGGDPMDEEDYAGISSWGLGGGIGSGGTSTVGHLMFDQFELVEK